MLDPFTVHLERNEGRAVVTCEGELDLSTLARLEEAVEHALSSFPRTLAIDATDLTFIGSDGVRVLLRASQRCADQRISFELVVSERTMRIFRLLGLEGIVTERRGRERTGSGERSSAASPVTRTPLTGLRRRSLLSTTFVPSTAERA